MFMSDLSSSSHLFDMIASNVFGRLQKPHVLVLGLGESGLACARWCLQYGCRIRIADTRLVPPKLKDLIASIVTNHAFQNKNLAENKIDDTNKIDDANEYANAVAVDNYQSVLLKAGIEFYAGCFTEDLLSDIELIAISPGLSLQEKTISQLLNIAKEKDIPIWGEFEFFSLALKALAELDKSKNNDKDLSYQPKILAITGTNGKTTTAVLTEKMIARCGYKTALAGNISPALLDRLRHALEQNKSGVTMPEVWVIEASSFQLSTTQSFNPNAAALLNITADHLDWHINFDSYCAAKNKIFGNQTLRILCRDDSNSMQNVISDQPYITFGKDLPKHAGDFGIQQEDAESWLVYAQAIQSSHDAIVNGPKRRLNNKPNNHDKHLQNFKLIRLMPLAAMHIQGWHNANNALAALSLAKSIGCTFAPALHALHAYRGEPHRMQQIATINRVHFIDDSKATNVGATIAALEGLAKRCYLIAGGDGKQQDFSLLAPALKKWCQQLFLIGRDAKQIAQVISNSDVTIEYFSSLINAVNAAAKCAQPGETILLSPACASLDMFENYHHRGEVFQNAVTALAKLCTPSASSVSSVSSVTQVTV